MQLSPYKHRTYRPPGYRRPLRGCLKRPVDFSLNHEDLRSHYFLIFLLRYDPFSRLRVEGEAKIQLSEIDGLIDGNETSLIRELVESEQQFTGFVFRQGSGSTRSLNGSTRSHNGSTRSPSNLRRSLDDNTRGSTRSFNGFSRSPEEAVDDTAQEASESVIAFARPRIESPVLSRFTEDKMRESSRSFSGAIGSSSPSTPPSSRMMRQAADGTRESSRSFSGFTRARNGTKLPPSGLARSTDEKHHDALQASSRGLMRLHDEVPSRQEPL